MFRTDDLPMARQSKLIASMLQESNIHKVTIWKDDESLTLESGLVREKGNNVELRVPTPKLNDSPFGIEPVDVSVFVSTVEKTRESLQPDEYYESSYVKSKNIDNRPYTMLKWLKN